MKSIFSKFNTSKIQFELDSKNIQLKRTRKSSATHYKLEKYRRLKERLFLKSNTSIHEIEFGNSIFGLSSDFIEFQEDSFSILNRLIETLESLEYNTNDKFPISTIAELEQSFYDSISIFELIDFHLEEATSYAKIKVKQVEKNLVKYIVAISRLLLRNGKFDFRASIRNLLVRFFMTKNSEEEITVVGCRYGIIFLQESIRIFHEKQRNHSMPKRTFKTEFDY